MSIPEYTARIISHKCDRDARRAIIASICDRDTIGGARSLIATRTRLLYDAQGACVAVVNIIDCDYDVLDEKPTDHDIIYVDFSKATPKYEPIRSIIDRYGNAQVCCYSYVGMDDQSEYKRQWVENVITDATVWVKPSKHNFRPPTGEFRVSCPYNAHPIVVAPKRIIPNSTIIDGVDTKSTWWKFIDDIFGIKGLQSVESYLEPYSALPVPGISALVAPICGNTQVGAPSNDHTGGIADVPWPIPEMMINIPPFVKVEKICHDPATNVITIRFG